MMSKMISNRPGNSAFDSPSGAAIETFSDLLAEAPNLDGVCLAAMQFAEQTIGAPSGVLVVQTSNERSPLTVVPYHLNSQQALQLDDPLSPLRQIARQVLVSGEMALSQTSSSFPALEWDKVNGLSLALPVPARSGAQTSALDSNQPIQGVWMVLGASCSPVEVDWLIKLSRPLARAIRMSRVNRSVFTNPSWWNLNSGRIPGRVDPLYQFKQPAVNQLAGEDTQELQPYVLNCARRLLDAEQSVLIILPGQMQPQESSEWLTRKLFDAAGKWIYQVDPLEGSGLVRECLRTAHPLLIENAPADLRYQPEIDAPPGVKVHSMIIAPLVSNGRILGAIQVVNKLSPVHGTAAAQNTNGVFSSQDLDHLCLIANLMANALFGSWLLERVNVADLDGHLARQEAGIQSGSRLELENIRRVLIALLENFPASMYMVDQNYGLDLVNLAAARRAGRPPAALLGLTCYSALYQRSEPCPGCMAAETLASGRSTLRRQSRLGEADETSEWEIRSYAVLDDGSKVSHAILLEQDISEKSLLEGFVAQSEKLAALGHLAASVAHEINNPLTAIIANAQILQRELPPGDERLESVDLIALAGARAAQMVRNLLDFARKEQGQFVLTNINDTLRSSLALVQHELMARSITLSFDPAENLPQVMARSDSLQGVWLNLLLNAIESIDRVGGMIRVTSRRVGDDLQVSIVDNGRGIPPDRLERIFEPFYTTKAPGRGTGLGLSVCSRIIEQHNGRMQVQSHVGVGSQFTVILPIN